MTIFELVFHYYSERNPWTLHTKVMILLKLFYCWRLGLVPVSLLALVLVCVAHDWRLGSAFEPLPLRRLYEFWPLLENRWSLCSPYQEFLFHPFFCFLTHPALFIVAWVFDPFKAISGYPINRNYKWIGHNYQSKCFIVNHTKIVFQEPCVCD